MRTTIIDKIRDSHTVLHKEGFPDIFYIDLHLVHEVTSPQAFSALRDKNLPVRRIDKTFATADHNVPTKDQHLPIKDQLGRIQVATLEKNCAEFGVPLFGMGHENQGIVHVIGPQLGLTQPGKTIVCGDSHTSTHGALGAIAFGIGTTEVGHVLATQCLLQTRPKTMKISFSGQMGYGVSAKDIILYLIAKHGFRFGTGYFVEYAGDAIRNLSMEGRMTICNMSIEFGARGGIIAPDQTTYAYIQGTPYAPTGDAWDQAIKQRDQLVSDVDATYDAYIDIHVDQITPMITYGTNPGMGIGIQDTIPTHEQIQTNEQADFDKALTYMGLTAGQKLLGHPIDYVFIGSCTNSRIHDLRAVANILQGKKIADKVTVWIVPGSYAVAKQAEKEGLARIFTDAGCEWRGAGCSACLGMNEDKIPASKYCVSTSNRNFEGRQGPGARTFLASPQTAAACALTGVVTDIRTII